MSVDPPVPTLAAPGAGNGPVLFPRDTAARVLEATRYVERFFRGGRPPDPRTARGFDSAGVWGFLAAGATITAASGLTLGSGTVTLCTRSGASCTANGITVTVYSAGGAVSGGASGLLLKLGWTDGDWSLDVAACP